MEFYLFKKSSLPSSHLFSFASSTVLHSPGNPWNSSIITISELCIFLLEMIYINYSATQHVSNYITICSLYSKCNVIFVN